jgi:hypothetical protein
MPSAVAPTSVRLSEATKKLLDEAAKKTRRSRSFLVEETLKLHLPSIVRNNANLTKEEKISRLKELQGIGVRLVGPQTAEEIDARIRAFRGDE